MHKYVQMTIFIPATFLQRGVIFVCPFSLVRKIDGSEYPWGISSRCESLGALGSTFSIFQSM